MTMIEALDPIDRQLVNTIQLDFPLNPYPFRILGGRIGISEEEVIDRLKKLTDIGVVRKIGPILSTTAIGGSSTLIAMQVPEYEVDRVAARINEFGEVSHNYLRPGKYNLWFTISARKKERLHEIISEISELDYPFLNLPVNRLFKIGVKFEV